MSDTTNKLVVSISSNDDLPLGLGESVIQKVIATAEDQVGFVIDDVLNTLRTLISTNDNIKIGLTETALPFDLGGLTVKTGSDPLSIGITETAVVTTVLVDGPSVIVATVEYIGELTVDAIGGPLTADRLANTTVQGLTTHTTEVVGMPLEVETWNS